tara:strand:+ start:901 stop:1197 length:297 start_codon:yes stop_codon:yes gene_type:complete
MNKVAVIVLAIGLSACGSSPEDQLKDCTINGLQMIIDEMRKGSKLPQGMIDQQDKNMAEARAMTWEQLLNSDTEVFARQCLNLQKQDPEKFNEMVNLY